MLSVHTFWYLSGLGGLFLIEHVEEKALWREKVAWAGEVRF